jgi:hypothetical protein
MARRSRGNASPYEVRCPRCDVSFPVETRKCIHCGGPTGRPAELVQNAPLDSSDSNFDFDHASSGVSSAAYEHLDNTPIEPVQEAIFSPGGVVEGSSGITIGDSIRDAIGDPTRGGSSDGGAASESTPQSTSIVGKLVRSLGGLIWVILLIGFSLARSCED